MAESNLNLTRAGLSGALGTYFGFGRGSAFGETAWTASQQAMIDLCLDSGYRRFIHPAPQTPGGDSYEWSFLRPVATLVLKDGQNTIALPDDFGGVCGDLLVTTEGKPAIPIPITGEVRRRIVEAPDTTGQPLFAEVEPIKGTSATGANRFQLRFWPTADQDYTLELTYTVHPDQITADRPYAYGGMAHAETLLESCLAVAEERFDDAQGVHRAAFHERLAASIALDRRNKPQRLGYNRDNSDFRRDQHGRRHWPWGNPVTIQGVQY